MADRRFEGAITGPDPGADAARDSSVATLDTIVLFALVRHRGWFDARSEAATAGNASSTGSTPANDAAIPRR